MLTMQNLPFLKNVNKYVNISVKLTFFFSKRKPICRFSASILKIDKQITFHS